MEVALFAKASHFGRGGTAGMTERVSLLPWNIERSDTMPLLRVHRVAAFFLFVSVLTLSVCFADSSPGGRAKADGARGKDTDTNF